MWSPFAKHCCCKTHPHAQQRSQRRNDPHSHSSAPPVTANRGYGVRLFSGFRHLHLPSCPGLPSRAMERIRHIYIPPQSTSEKHQMDACFSPLTVERDERIESEHLGCRWSMRATEMNPLPLSV